MLPLWEIRATGSVGAGDLDCRNCGKTGHIERACTTKKSQTQTHRQQREKKKSGFHRNKEKHVNKMEHHQDEQDDTESDDEDTVHILAVEDGDDDGYWVTPILENQPVRMQVDTGTRVLMVSEAVYKEKLPLIPSIPYSSEIQVEVRDLHR